ncbi:hypothetical protein DPMN_124791 [Dreissena polymorpha]|uniref:Uncharacterized protein n=1 Tax=Dreissena polymorpha TaxID=45954 RepID=A0A9D4JWI6_DREPO|nr:hypothetical protein DPMN_124791 [Dreissena polymorpha]
MTAEYHWLKFGNIIVISEATKTHMSHAAKEVVNTEVEVVVCFFDIVSNTKLCMQIPKRMKQRPKTPLI